MTTTGRIDLAEATAIRRSDHGTWCGTIPAAYVMGPAAWGGYVAALCLRGSAASAELPRPATVSIHFLRPAIEGPFEFQPRSLRRGRRSESMSGVMFQGGKAVAASLAAFVADELSGLDHDLVAPPVGLPDKTKHPSVDELRDRFGLERSLPWEQLEVRLEAWADRTDRDPTARSWFRFHPTATFDDRVLEACRVVVAVDTTIGVTGLRPHTEAIVGHSSFPPSMDLNVTFHHAPRTEWLFGETEASISTGGLMAGTVRMWNEDGELCGTALSTMFWLSSDPIVGPSR
jgi:acyl-CoA thioesterase II